MSTRSDYTESERLEISQTILTQMGGYGRLSAMIGIYNLLTTDDPEPGLVFMFKGSRVANKCKVSYLPGPDLYKFELFKYTPVRYSHCPCVYQLTDVYADMFIDVFEQETGLYLTL